MIEMPIKKSGAGNQARNGLSLSIIFILLVIVPASAVSPTPDPGVVSVYAVIPPSGQANPAFPFHNGDTITLTGTNMNSRTTYLFLVGPNLNASGSQIESEYPAGTPVIDGNASTFATAAVGSDSRWTYAWDTTKSGLASGTYTVYAVSSPRDKNHLEFFLYGTTPIILVDQESPTARNSENLVLEELVIVNPGGPVLSGTPVNVTASIDFDLNRSETFPADHDLVFSTTLDNPEWSYTLILEGVENQRTPPHGTVLDLSGFELSYPGTVSQERVVVMLRGTAPAVKEARTKNVIQISVVDRDGNIVPNSTVTREITVLPLPGVTQKRPTLTPTTAPLMHR